MGVAETATLAVERPHLPVAVWELQVDGSSVPFGAAVQTRVGSHAVTMRCAWATGSSAYVAALDVRVVTPPGATTVAFPAPVLNVLAAAAEGCRQRLV